MKIQLNTIYNLDCIDLLKNIDNNFIDLIITSPPYDNLRNYDGYTFDFYNIAKELYRIVKKGGVIVWVVGDSVINGSETGTSFKQALYFKELGFNLHDTMIFEKNSSTFPARKNGNRYTQIFEYMFILSKGKPKTANLICDKKNKWEGYKDFSNILKNPVPKFSPRTNIWKYTTSFDGIKHPAPFPLKLAEEHILTWSKKKDIILDPFGGSGTTGIAARNLERNFILCEVSSKYCKLIQKKFNTKEDIFEKDIKIKKTIN